jgi:hypothetical protein
MCRAICLRGFVSKYRWQFILSYTRTDRHVYIYIYYVATYVSSTPASYSVGLNSKMFGYFVAVLKSPGSCDLAFKQLLTASFHIRSYIILQKWLSVSSLYNLRIWKSIARQPNDHSVRKWLCRPYAMLPSKRSNEIQTKSRQYIYRVIQCDSWQHPGLVIFRGVHTLSLIPDSFLTRPHSFPDNRQTLNSPDSFPDTRQFLNTSTLFPWYPTLP